MCMQRHRVELKPVTVQMQGQTFNHVLTVRGRAPQSLSESTCTMGFLQKADSYRSVISGETLPTSASTTSSSAATVRTIAETTQRRPATSVTPRWEVHTRSTTAAVLKPPPHSTAEAGSEEKTGTMTVKPPSVEGGEEDDSREKDSDGNVWPDAG